MEALSTVHNALADDEKRGVKRKLATSEQELTKTQNILTCKHAWRALDCEEINIHCNESRVRLNGIHDKLVEGFRNGMHLSKAEVWEMMRSIINVSDRLTYIQQHTIDSDEHF